MQKLESTGKVPMIVKTGLHINDMSQFASLNVIYAKSFGVRPPARVCVQVPGNEIVAYFIIWKDPETLAKVQQNMHVQSISHWAAPAIGPYSQANMMGDFLLLAGNIGLYPPKLAMIHATDIVWQYRQVKANFNSVIRKICNN